MNSITNRTKKFQTQVDRDREPELLQFINDNISYGIFKFNKKLEKLPSSEIEIRRRLDTHIFPNKESIIRLRTFTTPDNLEIEYKIYNRLFGIKLFFMIFSIFIIIIALTSGQFSFEIIFAIALILVFIGATYLWDNYYFKTANQEFLNSLNKKVRGM